MILVPNQNRKILLSTNPRKRRYEKTSLSFMDRSVIYLSTIIGERSPPKSFHSILPHYRIDSFQNTSLLDISSSRGVLLSEIGRLLSTRMME